MSKQKRLRDPRSGRFVNAERLANEYLKQFEISANRSLPQLWSQRAGTSIDAFFNANPTPALLIKEYARWNKVCIDRNAQMISGSRLRLYTTNPKAGKSVGYLQKKQLSKQIYFPADDVKEITYHTALNVLNNFSDMTLNDLLFFTVVYESTCGVAYWLKIYNEFGKLSQIKLLMSQFIVENRDANNEIVSYSYGTQPNENVYLVDEIIRFGRWSVNDWRSYDSATRGTYYNLTIESRLLRHETILLSNQGRPDFVMAPKGEYNDLGFEETARLEQKINQRWNNAGAGGGVVLPNDMTITPLGFSPRDMSYLNIQENCKDIICQSNGIPIALITSESSNRATYYTALQDWVNRTIKPKLRAIESILNKDFLPLFGNDLFFCFDDPCAVDPIEQTNNLIAQKINGIITDQEARVELGYSAEPEIGILTSHNDPQGLAYSEDSTDTDSEDTADTTNDIAPIDPLANVASTALTGVQITSMVQVVQSVVLSQLPLEAGRQILYIAFPTVDKTEIDKLINSVRGFTPTDNTPKLYIPNETKAHRKHKVVIKPPEFEELEKTLKEFFIDQKEAYLAKIKKDFGNIITKGLPDKFVPVDKWTKEMDRRCKPLIELQYSKSGKSLLSQVGASPNQFDVKDKNLQKIIDKQVFKFCEETNATTTKNLNDALDELRDKLEEGLVEDGQSLKQLTEAVGEVFDSAEEYRARRIAKTESAFANNNAVKESARQSGVVKSFYIIPNSGACQQCLDFIEENPEIAIDSDLLPPIHPNCECSTACNLTEEKD